MKENENIASEPAVAYTYAREVHGTGCTVHGIPTANTVNREPFTVPPCTGHRTPDTSELSPEIIKILDERLKGIENGTAKFISAEQMHEKHLEWRKKWKQIREQKNELTYATI